MKKYLILSVFALVTFVFSACQSNEPCHFHKESIELVVNQNMWEFDSSANMYYCHFNVPEITSDVYKYGEWSINREYNSGSKNAYQVALPETTYKSEEIDNGDSTTSTVFYQQHIDYAVGVGMVEVFCTISDFYYEGFTPESMIFRLQLTY
jgi:hypothetical protein